MNERRDSAILRQISLSSWLPLYLFLISVLQLNVGTVHAAIGFDVQLGYAPKGLRWGGQHQNFPFGHLNDELSEEKSFEVREETHSSKEESVDVQQPPELESEEQQKRRPITVGVIMTNMDHLCEYALNLRVTLNEFHRWEVESDPCAGNLSLSNRGHEEDRPKKTSANMSRSIQRCKSRLVFFCVSSFELKSDLTTLFAGLD